MGFFASSHDAEHQYAITSPRSPVSVRDVNVGDETKRNTSLVRRDSTTEEIILPDLTDNPSLYDSTCDWGETRNSSLPTDGSLRDLFYAARNHSNDSLSLSSPNPVVDTFHHSCKNLLLLGQMGSERNKARAVTQNKGEFRRLKQKLKENGMVTNY